MKWLLDVNVVLDVLSDREPWAEHSAWVLGRVERGAATGLVGAHGHHAPLPAGDPPRS